MSKKLALLFCLMAMPLIGKDLSGEYGVTGFNPNTQEAYRGRVTINETGDVYDITWQLKPKGPVYQGTGIRKGDTISAAFRNVSNPSEVGVMIYSIQNDGSLAGKWVFLGRNKKGSETLKLAE